jgi:beta-barrel assembly-enhancing protease
MIEQMKPKERWSAGHNMVLHMFGHLKDLLPDLAQISTQAFEAFTSPTLDNKSLLDSLPDGRHVCPDKCLSKCLQPPPVRRYHISMNETSPAPRRIDTSTRKRGCARTTTLLLLTALLVAGCVSNPITGRRELSLISEQQELRLGAETYPTSLQAQGGTYNAHPEVQTYVDSVMHKVAAHSDRPELPYEIAVLNNGVPNAWALPGGKMAINRGLLTELKSEAELAAVLGHEIVHIAARHGAKVIERGMLTQGAILGVGLALDDHEYRDVIVGGAGLGMALVSLKYSRVAELESDNYGIKYMVAAGYDPAAAVELQQTFLRLSNRRNSGWLAGLLASHPPSQERVDANRQHVSGYSRDNLFVGREEYLLAMEPLIESKAAYDTYETGQAALDKDPSKTARLAREAIDKEPREAQFYGLLAKALAAQQRPTEAITALNQAIKLQPNYFDYYLTRGHLRKTMGDTEGASTDFTRSIQLLPTASAHAAMGQFALAAGRSDLAIPHLRAAASADSLEGQQARKSLIRLELPSAPGRYLRASYSLDKADLLVVTLWNPTTLSVATCNFTLQTPTRSTKYTVSGGIPAGATRRVPTKVGPFTDVNTAARQVTLHFNRVTLAD